MTTNSARTVEQKVSTVIYVSFSNATFKNNIKTAPDWASVNLGIFICIECAGIHKRIGPAVTQVRSVQLDKWTDKMVNVSDILC